MCKSWSKPVLRRMPWKLSGQPASLIIYSCSHYEYSRITQLTCACLRSLHFIKGKCARAGGKLVLRSMPWKLSGQAASYGGDPHPTSWCLSSLFCKALGRASELSKLDWWSSLMNGITSFLSHSHHVGQFVKLGWCRLTLSARVEYCSAYLFNSTYTFVTQYVILHMAWNSRQIVQFTHSCNYINYFDAQY